MGNDHKNGAIFFRFVLRNVSETKEKVFPTRKKVFFKTKMFLFRKYLRNECFRNESEIVFVLEMKIF